MDGTGVEGELDEVVERFGVVRVRFVLRGF
jgi:hypothetical protein